MKVRTLLHLFVFILFFPILLVRGSELPPELERIKSRGKLVVAMVDQERPPFFMHDKNGNFVGMDVELAHDIAQKFGVLVEFNRSAKTFDEVIEQIANQKADVGISRLSVTPARALRVRFTQVYGTLSQVLLVNRLLLTGRTREQDLILQLNQKGMKIGVLGNSSYVDFGKRDFPSATIVPYPNIDEMYGDVANGKISVALHDDVTISHWLYSNPKATIKVHKIPHKDRIDPKALAVSWENTPLLAWLNTYLEVAKLDGTLERLTGKYLKSDDWRK